MSPDQEEQLALFDTDDLVDELMLRFDHAIFHGMKCPVGGRFEQVRRWYGNSMTCTGLATDIGISICDEFHEHSIPTDDSDVVPDDDEGDT